MGLEKRFPTILDERVLHARDYVIATTSHPFFKLKWFSGNQKDVAVELLVDEAKKVEDFRSTEEADKGSFLSGDEYFDLNDEETTRDNSGNRGRETNSVKMEVLSYLNERRKELSGLSRSYPRIMEGFQEVQLYHSFVCTCRTTFFGRWWNFYSKKKHAQKMVCLKTFCC